MFRSIYIHVPFCRQKCNYCAFYSEAQSNPTLINAWANTILKHAERNHHHMGVINSIYIGGGTPTMLPPNLLANLLKQLTDNLQLAPDCEISCESNPDSLTPQFLEQLTTAGVNRLSIGVQSFIPQHRKTLGRHASPDHLAETIAYAHNLGLHNINIDLIYAIPGQTLEDWISDLTTACQLNVNHLSAYSLTIEEGTQLAREQTQPIDEDLDIAMWKVIPETLAPFGLQRYEISNYAKPGYRCRHNNEIWHGQTYLGLGPAAASFDGTQRFCQCADLNQWLKDAPPEQDILPSDERAAEILAFGMRTCEGWDLNYFRQLTGFDADLLRGEALRELEAEGLIVRENQHIRCTEQGLLLNNDVLMQLL